ncbi:hypothetical protein TRICI_000717 [Trichomonascus ciferrii]|uniref:Peptide N-acetyl-beta-D-glucosaminyl asparaginase amidase A N-terminal domain-containing protein n=1 Tax=Trichomonascus ciferrii TaxID=44093 RepID=A0A642VB83_9ASCO|nr:hypothetical protein TRICI_000717 [Trichomonascus ciferrii]
MTGCREGYNGGGRGVWRRYMTAMLVWVCLVALWSLYGVYGGEDAVELLGERGGRRIFEVTEPSESFGRPVGKTVLVDHVFENSWGKPFEAEYVPPPPTTEFSHVKLILQGSTHGVQFDRLAHLFLGGSEIWRTSTPEPGGKSITWDYVKDVSAYAPLFRERQRVRFWLNNVVDGRYTGPLKVRITAYFYNPPRREPSVLNTWQDRGLPASRVRPLLAGGRCWELKASNEARVEIDSVARNATRVAVQVFASGNAREEFWYSHLLDEYADKFSSDVNDFGGHGPVRYVEVAVDGYIAGVVTPFAAIYTGGLSPALWNPIVGIKTYDLPSYVVDLTPFLPLLWSKKSTIGLRIVNGLDKHGVDSNWLVSANLLVWEVPHVHGTGQSLEYKRDDRHLKTGYLSHDKRALNQIVASQQSVRNRAQLSFADQGSFEYSWLQRAGVSNVQSVGNGGTDQQIALATYGDDRVFVDDTPVSDIAFSYPMVLSTKLTDKKDGYSITLGREYRVTDGSRFVNIGLNASSVSYIQGSRFLGGSAATEVEYESNRFYQHVKAVNGSVVDNHYVPQTKTPRPNTLTTLTELTARRLLGPKLDTAQAFAQTKSLFDKLLPSSLHYLFVTNSTSPSKDPQPHDFVGRY